MGAQSKKPVPQACRACGARGGMAFALRFDRGQGREGREGHPRLRELQVQKGRGAREHAVLVLGPWVTQCSDVGEEGTQSRDQMTQSWALTPPSGATVSVGCPVWRQAPHARHWFTNSPPKVCPRVPAGGGCF